MDKFLDFVGRHTPDWLIQFVHNWPALSFIVFVVVGACSGVVVMLAVKSLLKLSL